MFLQEAKAQVLKHSTSLKKPKTNPDSSKYESQHYYRADWQKIDVDFLNSYYSQDGNNGAVTGGIGTERLTDFTQKLSISFPTSPQLRWNIDAAYDYYSSASTDNIDNIRSSDSSSDIRSQLNIGIQYQHNQKVTTGLRLGTSIEYDYTSFHAGANFSILSSNGNRRFDAMVQSFYDTWIPFYPTELRGMVSIPTDKRQTYNAAVSLSQVLNSKLQVSIMGEATYMNGLLSTPFHRVYFNDQPIPDIERLPDNRLKIPLGLRMNAYLSERLILRSYYRYYWDSWDMSAHTINVELPIKINRFFTIYPHYRYHTQSAAEFFAPYAIHSSDSNFYTSDYDLSSLNSHTYGIGVMYSPNSGIARLGIPFSKGSSISMEAIDIKASVFNRNTGLNAWIVSIGFKFGI